MSKTINQLIINSPYTEPVQHWSFDRNTGHFNLAQDRRKAGYVKATPGSQSYDDPGIFVEIELVNRIRPRVKAWREDNYPGATGISRRLLRHWRERDPAEERCFFFCQLEAIETLIWLNESPAAHRVGIDIPSDGGSFSRWCSKMATGSGKTVVMSMIIAWQVLNKVANSRDKRYSKYVFVVAPNLTVRSRLQVLNPSAANNYYEVFNVVPASLMEQLRQGKVCIENWHTLAWETEEQLQARKAKGQLRSVDRRKSMAITDATYVQKRLGPLSKARNLIVINDEAHHAWRYNPRAKLKGTLKEDKQTATVWVGGLDRIHRHQGILRCFDLSATPFAPSGKKSEQEALFSWVVSDFGLNDAIESGLVKTPRVVVRETVNGKIADRSKLYHLYAEPEVKDSIKGKASPTEPLPDLLKNAYYLLGRDWQATQEAWAEQGHNVPPVMMTVANRVETSARIQYAFSNGHINIPELSHPQYTLRIDNEVLKKPDAQLKELHLGQPIPPLDQLTIQQRRDCLQEVVDTVGKVGKSGQYVRNVLSVGMLSEGWDAQTVTHIMGLRAFSSQLLCEQVIGRGLRRVSYEVNDQGLLEPEYINIFGVPFSFLPHEGGTGSPPPPPQLKVEIKPEPSKKAYEIVVPNFARLEYQYSSRLILDWDKIRPFELDPRETITVTDLSSVIEGRASLLELSAIQLDEVAKEHRLQTVMFRAAAHILDGESEKAWAGRKAHVFMQLVQLIETFFQKKKIAIRNNAFEVDSNKGIACCLVYFDKIVRYIWGHVRETNTSHWVGVYDSQQEQLRTGKIRPWYTSQSCAEVEKCHLNHCVYKGTWEQTTAYALSQSKAVAAFVKNDRLCFFIHYLEGSLVRRYRPDYVVRLTNGDMVILILSERPGKLAPLIKQYLNHWVSAANTRKRPEKWHWNTIRRPGEAHKVLASYL